MSLKSILAAWLFFTVISVHNSFCQTPEEITLNKYKFDIPEDYLLEPEQIPGFWLTTVDHVSDFLTQNIHKGKVEVLGHSAGGRPIYAVMYGQPRQGNGTTTFSGSLGFGKVQAYRGPDHDKTVYLAMASVHGGEFEGIVGIINLLSVLETGKDIRGKDWPEIHSAMTKLNRIILIPIMNPDGRARIPLRMERFRGTSKNANAVHEYFNTGGNKDGTNIGWPQVKEYIPLDFSSVGFPGGYPNDAGVNIQHDDFLGTLQPETQALFDLVAREKPDLTLNMHTGAPGFDYYIRLHRPVMEAVLVPVFDSLYKYVHSKLALEGLQGTMDPATETDPLNILKDKYNLDAALNLHCGSLSLLIEAPSHSFAGTDRSGEPAIQTPEMILDAELVVFQETMKFLVETGGRSKWTPDPRRK